MKYFEQLGSPFMSHFARRLADLINEQATEVLKDLELSMPSSAISTMQFINLNTDVTVTHIAEGLGVTHQMATQRINSLEKLSLVIRAPLPGDHRAKQVLLSRKGQNEMRALHPFMDKMNHIFEGLEAELGHKLSKHMYQAELSLRKKTLKERYQTK